MTLNKYFRKYGIRIEALIDTALEMYIPDPDIGPEKKMRAILRKGFENALKDINIASLLLAGFLLEEALENGKSGILTKKRYRSDPVDLIADELLGIQIALYIAGSRSIFEFERFDKTKPGILNKLPPILDDCFGGLVSGVLVKACSR